MKKHILIGLNIAALTTVGYFSFTSVSSAQAPKGESIEQKVVRLEKEVTELRKEIAALKQYRSVGTWTPNYLPGQPAQKLPGTPYSFNGQTYYLMPLNSNGARANGAAKTPSTAITLLAQPAK
jgi:hypothetical protein